MCLHLTRKKKKSLEMALDKIDEVADFYATTVGDILNEATGDMDELISLLQLPLKDDEILKQTRNTLTDFLSVLRKDLTVVVETHYVDRMYRDSYYYMYSKMSLGYNRYCLRLSFIGCKVDGDDLFDYKNVDKMRSHYLGFLVLRPLLARCIGRNVISPKALQKSEPGISICVVDVSTSVCGASVSVKGFPHCSQDMETMSCAESTLWAIMEYYSYKSPLYKLILPSEIHSVLAFTSKERQLPSHGLLFEQISTVLCHCGFECVIYSNEEWKNSDITFQEVFSCYVESGIPLAVCIKTADEEYHAVVCNGKQVTDLKNILNGNPMGASPQGWNFNRWNKCLKDFVFSDDNRPCYQKVTFEKPTDCYDDPERWGDGCITHFIAPLPKKVYIDAKSAIAISNSILTDVMGLSKGTCVRTFLTSCQSFTDFIVGESEWSVEDKTHFVGLKMPKYIWVTEFTDLTTFQSGYADGLLILDATGQTDTSSMIYYRMKSCIMYYDDQRKKMVELTKTNGKPTRLYNRNLNSY